MYIDNMPSLILDGTRWTSGLSPKKMSLEVCLRVYAHFSIYVYTALFIIIIVPHGACDVDASYCFGRLPGALNEADTELLAFDSAGTIYR